MLIWHTIWNFLHCLPVFISGSTIILYHQSLLPYVLESEIQSYNVIYVFMIIVPILILFVIPVLQIFSLYFYYNHGHPWCRLFKIFVEEKEEKINETLILEIQMTDTK